MPNLHLNKKFQDKKKKILKSHWDFIGFQTKLKPLNQIADSKMLEM